jgi:hypothetical protein
MIAAIIIAVFGGMDLVETQVATALGASVQPLTKITPRVRSVIRIRIGFFAICEIKSDKLIGTPRVKAGLLLAVNS